MDATVQQATLVIPAERAGLRPARESRNPVTEAARAFTPAVDYWVPPPRTRGPEPGSLGRDDSPYAIGPALKGGGINRITPAA